MPLVIAIVACDVVLAGPAAEAQLVNQVNGVARGHVESPIEAVVDVGRCCGCKAATRSRASDLLRARPFGAGRVRDRMSPAIRQAIHRQGRAGDFKDLADSAVFFRASLSQPVQSIARAVRPAGFPSGGPLDSQGQLAKTVVGDFGGPGKLLDGFEDQHRFVISDGKSKFRQSRGHRATTAVATEYET
jgi:hypothetical protein